jgi:hypothetical protein
MNQHFVPHANTCVHPDATTAPSAIDAYSDLITTASGSTIVLDMEITDTFS